MRLRIGALSTELRDQKTEKRKRIAAWKNKHTTNEQIEAVGEHVVVVKDLLSRFDRSMVLVVRLRRYAAAIKTIQRYVRKWLARRTAVFETLFLRWKTNDDKKASEIRRTLKEYIKEPNPANIQYEEGLWAQLQFAQIRVKLMIQAIKELYILERVAHRRRKHTAEAKKQEVGRRPAVKIVGSESQQVQFHDSVLQSRGIAPLSSRVKKQAEQVEECADNFHFSPSIAELRVQSSRIQHRDTTRKEAANGHKNPLDQRQEAIESRKRHIKEDQTYLNGGVEWGLVPVLLARQSFAGFAKTLTTTFSGNVTSFAPVARRKSLGGQVVPGTMYRDDAITPFDSSDPWDAFDVKEFLGSTGTDKVISKAKTSRTLAPMRREDKLRAKKEDKSTKPERKAR
eukprot:TRINITY_DN13658_c0_g1_i2.p1 TRINITY_DN13658_c0_g1~~TRINITY_DN13658_c0_g1_i2.p1  ORF type:complete len:397 (+),score=67.59 TRINITY_DN13658_c0_g1_i2:52-1242(+)